ncbi:MAG: type II/IV secretion system protein [Sulfurimonas sp.]|nr:type II/IV secretion system protein [Sulfurimonas sp.]
MKKLAFTMIELVFVIVVIGIITAVMLPRIDRDNVYEAAQQVISHIKYTQHLAMIDNKFDDTDSLWYKELWQIRFQDCGAGNTLHAYSVFSDENHLGSINTSEAALDPLSRKRIDATNCVASVNQDPNVVLSNKYDIDTITLAGGCFIKTGFTTNKSIAFDNLGRPHMDLSNSVNTATTACTINLASNGENATITIEPETGYTYLSFITP